MVPITAPRAWPHVCIYMHVHVRHSIKGVATCMHACVQGFLVLDKRPHHSITGVVTNLRKPDQCGGCKALSLTHLQHTQ